MNEGELGESSSNNTKRRFIPTEISIGEASSTLQGFQFSPTDEQLIQHYLRKKIEGRDKSVDQVIGEVDIRRHEPWDLPAQAVIPSEDEWFFFSPSGRKYSGSPQCNRTTELGYWKAIRKEQNVKQLDTNHVIGRKRTLVFHTGRAPKGVRTEWIMNQYCTTEKSEEGMVVCRLRKNHEFHSKDNVRRGSQDDDEIYNDNNNNNTLLSGGEGGDQSGMLEGNEVENSCLNKDGSGSHSSEQPESSSCFKKSCIEEEEEKEDDCFADILKDDIIKLDDIVEDHRPVIKLRSKMKNTARPDNPTAMPFQGTAHRRSRLAGHKLQVHSHQHSHQQTSFVLVLVFVLVFVLVLVLAKLTII